MKNLTIGFLISMVLHSLCLFFFLHDHEKVKYREVISIGLYPELAAQSPFPENEASSETRAPSSTVSQAGGAPTGGNPSATAPEPGDRPGPSATVSGPEGIEYSKEPRYIPVPDTSRSILYTWRKSELHFKEALTGKQYSGGDVKKKVESWFSSGGTGSSPVRPDPAADHMKSRRGASPVLALPSVRPPETKKVEQNPPKFDFLPNPVQLNAMALLYKTKQATQVDLYADLDGSLLVTAEGLNANLEYLVKKGFLRRKKVSPENPLAIGSLFGGATIEMSRKNKLNPLYLYTPTVDRTTLISFFQAQIFLLKEKVQTSPSDSLYLRFQIDNLQDMVQVLIQTT